MSHAGASRRGAGAASLLGLVLLGLLGLLGRKSRTSLSVPTVSESRSAGTAEAPSHSGRAMPTRHEDGAARERGDSAPGQPKTGGPDTFAGVRGYAIGLILAAVLTAGSFWLSYTHLVYGPGLYVALIVFAIAQIGIHLVFFFHLTTSPDNINNAMALAFGVLILVLLIGGTLWIMSHMNHNMMPMEQMMDMQR